MKILVLSDSHQHINYMVSCIDQERPDVIIHLGDYGKDADEIHILYPSIPLYSVPGNCDEYSGADCGDKIQTPVIGGVRFFLTHGHLHQVKQNTYALIYAAEQANAAVALYGHTHNPDCRHLDSGLWIMNPGTCGFWGSSAGLITIHNGEVISAEIIH